MPYRFIGEYRHNIDDKGRLILPSRFRDKLGESFVVTCGLDTCLVVFPPEEWGKYLSRLESLQFHKKDFRAYLRLVLAKANDVEIDRLGRFTVPANLREYAGISREVVVNGVSDKIEIWSQQIWDEYSRKAISNYEINAETIGELE
ncbi:MAG: division/cell wall cluster transcriptional repressor MraZ [Candidatus Wallbacteria bacterium]|nr:division/cell wall cluster transcriptional repressor MraZ [Candidatus Wallbacteria bacterium]